MPSLSRYLRFLDDYKKIGYTEEQINKMIQECAEKKKLTYGEAAAEIEVYVLELALRYAGV